MGTPDYPAYVVPNIKQYIKELDKTVSHILILETSTENHTAVIEVFSELEVIVQDITKLIERNTGLPDKIVFLFRLAPCQINEVMAELALRGLSDGLWAFGEGYARIG